MKNNCFFNSKLYISGLKQLAAVPIFAAVVLSFLCTLQFILSKNYTFDFYWSDIFAHYAHLTLVPIMALYIHNYISNKNSTLPEEHSRASVIISYTIAMFTYTMAMLLVAIPTTKNVIYFLGMFSSYLLIAATFFLAWTLTNNTFSYIIIFLIISSPQIIITYVTQLVHELCPQLNSGTIPAILSPNYKLLVLFTNKTQSEFLYSYDYIPGIIFAIVTSIILISIALFILLKEEKTQKKSSLINTITKMLVKTFIPMAICLIPLKTIIKSLYSKQYNDLSLISLAFYLLIILFVYFICDIILNKKEASSKNSLIGLLLIVVLNVIIAGTTLIICDNNNSFSPNADEIDYVIIENGQPAHDVESYYQNIYKEVKVSDADTLKTLSHCIKVNNNNANTSLYNNSNNFKLLNLTIHSNGATYNKTLRVDNGTCMKLFENIEKTDEFVQLVSNLPEEISNTSFAFNKLNLNEIKEIYSLYIEELSELSIDKQREIISRDKKNFDIIQNSDTSYSVLEERYADSGLICIYYENNESEKPGNYMLVIEITEDTPKAYEKFLEYTEAK